MKIALNQIIVILIKPDIFVTPSSIRMHSGRTSTGFSNFYEDDIIPASHSFHFTQFVFIGNLRTELKVYVLI